MEAILMLIGYQESPITGNSRNKEEKMELINLGTMAVLERQGYFLRRAGEDNWPAFEPTEKEFTGNREQEIREGIVRYFGGEKTAY
jgi:hypothetical protein